VRGEKVFGLFLRRARSAKGFSQSGIKLTREWYRQKEQIAEALQGQGRKKSI